MQFPFRKYLILCLLTCTSIGVTASEKPGNKVMPPSMTQEELEQFSFDVDATPFKVSDLTVGQLYILNNHRADAKAMFARHLGILSLRGNKKDIKLLQMMVDRNIIKHHEVRKWQALGVLFGDVLANEFNMTWVRYVDRYGLNKALRWRQTDNFIFPLGIFSKRVQFGEKINVQAIYDKIAEDVKAFKAWELKPKLPNPMKPS